MSKEIWRDIPEYEGLYQVSTLGKVRSLDMEVECYPIERKPYTRLRKGKIDNLMWTSHTNATIKARRSKVLVR